MKREKSQLTKCSDCSLFDYGYVPPQLPGRPQYPTLWVGQAGGQTEDITGVPFTGKAGKMLWRLMKEAGLDKNKQPITNIACCVPPGDRKPTDQEIACCRPQLYDTIHRVEPQLIIALGDVASKALVGRLAIRSLRGQFFPLLSSWDYECPVLCCLHPSFTMRQRQWIDITIDDFKLVTKFFVEGIEVIDEEFDFIFDPDEHQLAEELEMMSHHRTAFDTETTGLNTRKDVIVGASLCCQPNRAIAFDLPFNDRRWEVLKQYLEDPKAEKITQNGQFDTAICETHGILIKGLTFDTLLAEHILHSDLLLNLDSLRGRYTTIKPYKPTKREMKTIQHWPKERRLTYGCFDGITTYRVEEAQMKLMTPQDLRVLNEIDLQLVPVVNKMERKGMLVDINTLALLYQQLLPQLEEMKLKYFNPLNLNPNSPVQLKPFFDIEDTEEDTLKKYIKKGHDQAELMKILLEYRGLQKSTSVYLLGVYDRLEEGRIHTQFNIAGTGTGRLSSTDPNLQNVFKEGRVIYIADDDEHILAEGDYSQLELRVVAVLANETTLLDELAKGINIHHLLAYEMFHKQWKELTDVQKLREKAVVFGTVGGRSARSIAMEFDIPTTLAEQWQALCFNKYPQFIKYKEKQTKQFNDYGQCTTAFGRVRTLQGLTQAFNTPMQGSAGDITKTSLIELDKVGFDLRLTVHDSIVTQLERKDLDDQLREKRKIMERPIKELNNYQFPIKIGVGSNWFELEERR